MTLTDQNISQGESTPLTQNQNSKYSSLFIPHKVGIPCTMLVVFIIFYFQLYLTSVRYFQLEQQFEVSGISESPVLFGHKMDISDTQMNYFLKFIPLIFTGGPIFLVISMAIKRFSDSSNRQVNLQVFHIVFGLIICLFLLGKLSSVLIVFSFINYILSKLFFKNKFFLLQLWAYNLWFMYTYQLHLQMFEVIYSHFQFLGDAKIYPSLILGLTMLRMISFSSDLYWCDTNKVEKFEFHTDSLKDRMKRSVSMSNYNLVAYYGYLLYTPIFVTGPQLTFNAYSSQCERSQFSYSSKQIFIYFIRNICNLGFLILFLVFCHANAISKHPKNALVRAELNIGDKINTCILNLIFLWLKFLCIWRVARTWALIDGIDTPENMSSCIYGNYCFEDFWRNWHRGFNLWNIRYIFVPLGGSKYKQYNIWAVFTFVAIWHDIEWNLVIWAWGVCLALIPEIAIKKIFNSKAKAHLWHQTKFVVLASLLCAFQILFMIIYNLVGFGIGKDSLWEILQSMKTVEGLYYFACNYLTLAVLTMSLFYVKQFDYKSMSS